MAMYELIRRIKAEGVAAERILYINFEDERLQFNDPSELDLILQAYRELYPQFDLSTCYFFFDEIQDAVALGEIYLSDLFLN